MDPFAVLGVAPGASADELRAARRRLALLLHPDRIGGDAEAMRQLNTAFDLAMAERDRFGQDNGGGVNHIPDQSDRREQPPRAAPSRVVHDVASFTIEALPAEAFEALLVVTSWLGEVLVDDPPYQLDVALEDPYACWCRLDLLPDAGATTVSLTLGGIGLNPPPDLDDVRDLWVANLNQLGRPES
jgi:curved DNA-binding protein CbpA